VQLRTGADKTNINRGLVGFVGFNIVWFRVGAHRQRNALRGVHSRDQRQIVNTASDYCTFTKASCNLQVSVTNIVHGGGGVVQISVVMVIVVKGQRLPLCVPLAGESLPEELPGGSAYFTRTHPHTHTHTHTHIHTHTHTHATLSHDTHTYTQTNTHT
jgi:ABC-type nickel/cobalt efflux system permease component RcnA